MSQETGSDIATTPHGTALFAPSNDGSQERPAKVEVEYDQDALASKLQNLMDASGDDEDITPDDDEVAEDETDESVEEDTDEEDVEDESVEDAEDDEDDEVEESEAAADKTAPTLPAAYRRSLKADGWTDEEIDSNYKQLGADKFTTIAERVHTRRNTEIAAWSEAGRQARDSGQTPDPKVSTAPQSEQTLAKLEALDVEKLKEEYGNDELIDALAGPFNKAYEVLNAIIPQVQAGYAAVQNAQMAELSREVNQFFSADDIKPFVKLYGDNPDALTPEQLDNRNRVLNEADAMVLGAKMQGRELTAREAMEYAHLRVSKDFHTAAVRKGIKREVKQRSRGRISRPSSKRAPKQSGPPSRSQLEAKTARRLKKAFS